MIEKGRKPSKIAIKNLKYLNFWIPKKFLRLTLTCGNESWIFDQFGSSHEKLDLLENDISNTDLRNAGLPLDFYFHGADFGLLGFFLSFVK